MIDDEPREPNTVGQARSRRSQVQNEESRACAGPGIRVGDSPAPTRSATASRGSNLQTSSSDSSFSRRSPHDAHIGITPSSQSSARGACTGSGVNGNQQAEPAGNEAGVVVHGWTSLVLRRASDQERAARAEHRWADATWVTNMIRWEGHLCLALPPKISARSPPLPERKRFLGGPAYQRASARPPLARTCFPEGPTYQRTKSGIQATNPYRATHTADPHAARAQAPEQVSQGGAGPGVKHASRMG